MRLHFVKLRLLGLWCVLGLGGPMLAAPASAQDAGAGAAPDAGSAPSVPEAAAPPVAPAPDAGAVESLPDAATAAPVAPAEPVVPATPAPEPVAPQEPVEAPAAEPAIEAKVAAPAAPGPSAPPTEAIEVTVVGTKLSRTAGSVQVLRNKDLERFNYDDPLRVLLSVPGVYIRGEDGMGLRPNISLRGVTPDRSKKVTLLEDGVLFGPAPYSAPAAYYFPLITRMEKVRVFKGPGTISYGPQTVSGTIDLVTRDIPSGVAGGADIAAGQYHYGKAHVYGGASTDQFGFLIEGVRLQNNGFKELPSGADTGFVRNEWMVKGSYVVDPRASVRNEFKLKLTYSDEVSNETYLGITDADFRKDPDQRYAASALDRMVNHRTSVVLTHKAELAKRWSVITNLYRHDFHRVWRRVNGIAGASLADVLANPTTATNRGYYDVLRGAADATSERQSILLDRNERDFVSTGIESRFLWEGATGVISHRFELGGRYHYDYIERRHTETGHVMSDGELTPDGQPTETVAFNRDTSHALALHALYAMTWSALTVTPGIRAELIRSSTNDRLEEVRGKRTVLVPLPGISAYYAILPDFGVLAGVYRGFSPPVPGSSSKVKVENSWNSEAGFRYMRGALRAEAIGFYSNYLNMTNQCTGGSGCLDGDTQVSLGRARVYGLELSGQHDLPAGPLKLPLFLSYTFTRGEFLHSFISPDPSYGEVRTGYEVPNVPEHQFRIGAGAEHKRAGGNVSLTYMSPTREIASSGDVKSVLHTDQQFVVDVAADAQLWKSIRLYLNVMNLFDARAIASHRPFGARPNAPRWVQVGVKGSY